MKYFKTYECFKGINESYMVNLEKRIPFPIPAIIVYLMKLLRISLMDDDEYDIDLYTSLLGIDKEKYEGENQSLYHSVIYGNAIENIDKIDMGYVYNEFECIESGRNTGIRIFDETKRFIDKYKDKDLYAVYSDISSVGDEATSMIVFPKHKVNNVPGKINHEINHENYTIITKRINIIDSVYNYIMNKIYDNSNNSDYSDLNLMDFTFDFKDTEDIQEFHIEDKDKKEFIQNASKFLKNKVIKIIKEDPSSYNKYVKYMDADMKNELKREDRSKKSGLV